MGIWSKLFDRKDIIIIKLVFLWKPWVQKVGLGSSVGWAPARLTYVAKGVSEPSLRPADSKKIPFSKELTHNYCALGLQLRA